MKALENPAVAQIVKTINPLHVKIKSVKSKSVEYFAIKNKIIETLAELYNDIKLFTNESVDFDGEFLTIELGDDKVFHASPFMFSVYDMKHRRQFNLKF